jgi:hypothetical protein
VIDGATLVWLTEGAPSSSPAAAPSEEARRALEAWAKARGAELTLPAAASVPPIAIDWSAGDAIEQGIARVRDALAGLDFDAAERELARAGAILRAHPELPQAAWLGAELQRAWSVRWLRAGDEARAKSAWQRAAGLDGGREAGLGEKAFEPGAPVTARVRFAGETAKGAGLRLDGEAITPGEVKRSEGEHALAVVGENGAATWAEWVSIAQGIDVRVPSPAPVACSRADVERARERGAVVQSAGVQCGRWVAAVAGSDGALRVAMCARGSCDPLAPLPATREPPWTLPPPLPEAHAKWPAWATWTLAGVGVVGAGFAIAAAAGAFKSSSPQETQFVNGGLQIHSF